MDSGKSLIQMVLPLMVVMVIACVTINIYFPAEKVESVAEGIVDDIRGKVPKKTTEPEEKKTPSQSHLFRLDDIIGPRSAYAQEVTEVSNAAIRALKDKMRQRFVQMKPFYSKGVLKEDASGYVAEGDMQKVDLKTRRQVKILLEAENVDRKALYQEVAVALKIDPGQIGKVGEIFAKEWQKSVQ